MRINSALPAGGLERTILDVCPKVTELDLSRNLFVGFDAVVEICSHLPDVRGVRLK